MKTRKPVKRRSQPWLKLGITAIVVATITYAVATPSEIERNNASNYPHIQHANFEYEKCLRELSYTAEPDDFAEAKATIGRVRRDADHCLKQFR